MQIKWARVKRNRSDGVTSFGSWWWNGELWMEKGRSQTGGGGVMALIRWQRRTDVTKLPGDGACGVSLLLCRLQSLPLPDLSQPPPHPAPRTPTRRRTSWHAESDHQRLAELSPGYCSPRTTSQMKLVAWNILHYYCLWNDSGVGHGAVGVTQKSATVTRLRLMTAANMKTPGVGGGGGGSSAVHPGHTSSSIPAPPSIGLTSQWQRQ